MGSAPKVLIVEDERLIAEYFKITIESLGYSVCGIAMTADDAVRLARDEDPAIVFMDVRLSGRKDGIDAANEIHRNKPVPTVYVTGSQEQSTMDRIKTDHPSDILIKPVLQDQFKEALAKFCPLH
jgi:CheY-like chemotaxis protein